MQGLSISTWLTKYGLTSNVSIGSRKPGTSNVSMASLFPLMEYYNTTSNESYKFSTKSLSDSYTLPVFRLRRASDNRSADVYISSSNVVTKIIDAGVTTTGSNSLSTWLNATSGYVSIWYDQTSVSGSTTRYALIEPTTTNQPLYDLSDNSVYFNNQSNGTSFGMYFRDQIANSNIALEILDMTCLVNMVPIKWLTPEQIPGFPEGGSWFAQDPIVGGERGFSVNDFGICMPGGSNFGWGTGTQDGAANFIPTNGFSNACLMSITRSSNGDFQLYRSGTVITSGNRQSAGVLAGPLPTYVGRNSDGTPNPRLNAKIRSLIFYTTSITSSRDHQYFFATLQ